MPTTIQQSITDKLTGALSPTHLEVINESSMHNVPPGSESHFRLRVVSSAFEGQRLVQRHRTVNKILADEIAGPIHALALEVSTPAEWSAEGREAAESPPCLGGDAAKV